LKKKEIFFPFRKFADEPKCKCLCVFAKCGSRVKPCVCCVQSSDSRFSNACGEPMAPPPCNPKAWAQSSKLTCCSPERLLSSSQPLMRRLRYLTCHKGRTSMLLGKLTQNPPAIESVAFLSHHENHMGCVMYRGRHSSCCQCFLLCNNGCVSELFQHAMSLTYEHVLFNFIFVWICWHYSKDCLQTICHTVTLPFT
jgi:hypothetical protein